MLSHRNEDKYPAAAEHWGEDKHKGDTSVDDEEESEVEIDISFFKVETEQAEEALGEDEEGEVDDVELVQASEDILLDIGHGAVVDTEDAARRDAQQDADEWDCSDQKL